MKASREERTGRKWTCRMASRNISFVKFFALLSFLPAFAVIKWWFEAENLKLLSTGRSDGEEEKVSNAQSRSSVSLPSRFFCTSWGRFVLTGSETRQKKTSTKSTACSYPSSLNKKTVRHEFLIQTAQKNMENGRTSAGWFGSSQDFFFAAVVPCCVRINNKFFTRDYKIKKLKHSHST